MDIHPDIVRAIRTQSRRQRAPRVVEKAGYATTLVETGGQNLDYGDRDSLGSFQQRPSQGWGTPAQVMDPNYAAKQFIKRAKVVARQHPDWNSAQIAQAVQRSAFPAKYGAHEVQQAAQSYLKGGPDGGGGSLTMTGPGRTDVRLQSRTIPGQSFEEDRRAARRGLLLGGDLSFGRLLQYKGQVNQLQDIPARKVRGDLKVTRTPGQKFKVPVGSGANGGTSAPGEVYEVFYDPMGRYWDSGGVHKGSIGGHGTHVHVAGQKEFLRGIGQLAQKMGLQVGENSMFGGETPTSGHADKSFHYKDEAIDVSGGTPAQRARFARIAMSEARRRARAQKRK